MTGVVPREGVEPPYMVLQTTALNHLGYLGKYGYCIKSAISFLCLDLLNLQFSSILVTTKISYDCETYMNIKEITCSDISFVGFCVFYFYCIC